MPSPAAGATAVAARSASPQGDPVIRLDSNENPYGPSDSALRAITGSMPESNRYAFTAMQETAQAIAEGAGVATDHVTLGCGSSEILEAAVNAFAWSDRALVTAAPTFELPRDRASAIGAPVREVVVDGRGRVDLDGMLARVDGAGLVYLCNPNNPTSTVHAASDVTSFIERVHVRSPRTVVLVDEAYHEYVDAPGYATAIPLAVADPLVVVTRTFSKIHGMAGLRIGYAVGQPDTVRRLRPWSGSELAMSVLSAAAARASLADTARIEEQRALNRSARAYLLDALTRAGCAAFESDANFVMADVGRDSRSFASACAARDVRIARPFPPLNHHARITVGTMEETRRAAAVMAEVLATPPHITAGWPRPKWMDDVVWEC